GDARRGVRRPRNRRAAGGRRQGPTARPLRFEAAVGRREPALLQLVRSARAEGPQRLSHVRPAHGAARIPDGRPLMARVVVALALLLAGTTLAACGGGGSAS